MNLIVINGPNLNLLGIREKDVYGERTYRDLVNYIKEYGDKKNIDISIYQDNSEGELVTLIQKTIDVYDGIIINPAAYSHYSIAILDALKAVNIPYCEVHLSDIYNREDFRKNSITALGAIKVFTGDGFDSYIKAIDYLVDYLDKSIKKD